MADRRSGGKPDLTPDSAAPPPGEPPDTIPIIGILGESGIASSVRLYLDRSLSTYYDIPIEGIAGREKVPADRSPLGVDCTELFVRKGIRLVVHHVDTRSVEEEFLSGDFTSPGSFAPAPPPGPGVPITASDLCATNIACDITVIGCRLPTRIETACTHFACFPGRTVETVCTQFGCGHTQLLGCGGNTTLERCGTPHTHMPGCASHLVCGVHTAATVCRPSLGIACTIQGCGPITIHPTIQTQIGCGPVTIVSMPGHCPTVGFCPSLAGCPSEICGDPFGGEFG